MDEQLRQSLIEAYTRPPTPAELSRIGVPARDKPRPPKGLKKLLSWWPAERQEVAFLRRWAKLLKRHGHNPDALTDLESYLSLASLSRGQEDGMHPGDVERRLVKWAMENRPAKTGIKAPRRAMTGKRVKDKPLTKRQSEVLEMFKKCDFKKTETANRLDISRATLDDHLRAIMLRGEIARSRSVRAGRTLPTDRRGQAQVERR